MTEDLLREPLPDPWTFGVTNDGRVFFINDDEKRTTWLHPDSSQPVRSGFRTRKDLPEGWEEGFTHTGMSYYINHNKGVTTFKLPEIDEKKSKSPKKSKEKSNEHLYQNIDPVTLREEKKKRRSSSFLERSRINIFRRSSSKSREKPEKLRQPSKRMREKKEKPEKKTKTARPVSAQSIQSNRSTMSIRSKMTVSFKDPKKDIMKSGWLYKQDSTGKMKMWRKKWFVLADFCLYYYKDSNGEEILGNIILPSYTVSTMTAKDKINRKYAFKVEHIGMRAYYLSADSYNDMAQWITALQISCSPLSLDIDNKSQSEPTLDNQSESSSDKEDDKSKGTENTKGKKKDSTDSKKKTKADDDDSEFGFNHVRVHPASSTTSSQSVKQEPHTDDKTSSSNLSSNNNKHDPQGRHKNGRVPTDSHRKTQSPKGQSHHDGPRGHNVSPRGLQNNYQQIISPKGVPRSPPNGQGHRSSGKDPRQRHGHTHRDDPNLSHQKMLPTHPKMTPSHQKMQPPHQKMPPPHQNNVRRQNGESAYFSDTSGATDSSRFANSSDRGNAQRSSAGQPASPPQTKVKRQDSIVKLGTWVMNQKMRQQSGNTLNISPQRTHPPSNFDTASEFSSVSQQHPRKSATLSARGARQIGPPPSSRRYRARTYNEYMDPMEVASSTISMPPMQHMANNKMYVAHTMPRTLSTEGVDKMGRPVRKSDPGHRMVSSKSAGNIVAVDQYGVPISPRHTPRDMNNPDSIKRAKSDYVFQNDDHLQRQYIANFKKAQSKDNIAFRAPRQQHRSQSRPQSAGRTSNSSSGGQTPRKSQNTPRSTGTPNDVFSPHSDVSSARGNKHGGQVFQFNTPNNKNSPYNIDTTKSATLSPTTRQDGVEVKQVQKGQLRAFVLSTRSPQVQLPPPERQTPLKATENITKLPQNNVNERDIESNLKRLNDSERTLQQISDDIDNLLTDRERLEAKLSITKFNSRNRNQSGIRDGQQLDMEQHKLEQELGNVNAQLANAAEKLKEMSAENESFENEIRKLKKRIIEELHNEGSVNDSTYNNVSNQDKDKKRKLEWELGRGEFIIEGLNKQKSFISNKLMDMNRNQDESPLISPKTPTSVLSSNGRSQRDVKRTSLDRRTTRNRPSYSSTSSGGTPNTTPVKKYFTLPGRGVSHAVSVDSVTAESLVMSSSRPTSARSVSSIGSSVGNLHRTKSAAERLFQTSYSNQPNQGSDHEAREMKRLQKEIFRNRRNNLKSGSVGDMPRRYSNPAGMTLPARSHVKVGIDVQMALKHHRMPKVLKRAKRDLARAEFERNQQIGFDIDDLDRQVNSNDTGPYTKESLYNYEQEQQDQRDSGRREEVEDEGTDEIHLDVNLTHQLIAPEKVEIPERYLEYEDIELTPAEEKMKHRNVAAIERMLAKSGQQASLPAVHLAAALAVEAGSVARAVAMHASVPPRGPGDGQKERMVERPVTDGSSSAGEEQEMEVSLLQQDPEYTAAYIV